MHVLRVVVDTNVLVSALFGIKNSPSSKVLHAIRTQKIILVTSPAILREIEEVISRERIIKLTKMDEKEREMFIEELAQRSDVIQDKAILKIGRDAKDDKFLFCSHEAKADYLITGDEDLLTLVKYEGTKILKPKDFVELLK